jgi:hypothetical protein
MNDRKKLIIVMAILAIGAFLPTVSSAAVTYFTDCAYTGSDLVCHVYANTGGDSLISAGVQLSYSTSELSNPIAVKNEEDWFFGNGTTNHSYMDPEVDTTNGTIVFIVGKLNESAPTQGVTGSRALIGTVSFTRSSTDDPWGGTNNPAAPVGFFGIDLALGRSGNYENFVNTDGALLDDTAIKGSIKIAERGDANANGVINATDYVAIRNQIGAENPPPYADCNGNGVVNATDYVCVRNKL